MHTHILKYRFNGEPRTHSFELHEPSLPVHDAAMHLLQLHFGDGENSLTMPSAEATPAEIVQQAELLGLSGIKVVTPKEDA